MVEAWAHRGASGHAPENTLAAFRRAIDLGADGVELDVQLCGDREMVVIHDETVERTTDGTGWVKDLPFDVIRGFDASAGWEGFAGERVPTLREVFELLAPTRLKINVEIKDSVIPYYGLGEKVSELVDEFGLEQRVTLSSFNHCSLAWLRQNGSMVRTGVLFSDVLFEPWNYAAQIWATALHPDFHYVDYVFNLIDEAHIALLDVNVWTVNEPGDIDRMIGRGVDAIITDFPERVLERR
ncbi:MAG: glycerophosphodiester phosphodiesterase [Propionibacteriaceae bacterium]|jgi:glycerophosphoryl diester phosphodiesterase|nr:glycerophosphodiester phosphodiesterase [Propionibacteriaceae bacterium]